MSMTVGLLNEISEAATRKSGLAGNEMMAPMGSTPNPGATPFGNLLTSTVSEVNHLEMQARSAVEGLMTGSGVDVHQAMIATQKADMAFEFALSVRNKAVQAYQQIMQMQF